jgi:membrane protein GlpM
MITTLAFIFTYSEAGREITRQLIISAFWFMIPLLLFLLALYFMMYRFSLPASIGGAYGIWIAAALIVNQLLSGG